MKKTVISMLLLAICMSTQAQVTSKYEKPDDSYTLDQNGQLVKKKRGLFDRDKKSKVIDAKYLEGAVPEVDDHVVFQTTIDASGKTADYIYEGALNYLRNFTKGEEMTELSEVSLVNNTDKEIGVRVQEWLVFEDRPLSLDRTKFNYQLIVRCFDGRCEVTMRNLTYLYDEERGGKLQVAEDIITDKESLNKDKTGFQRGGVKKFRMKTIDRKDAIFEAIAKAIK